VRTYRGIAKLKALLRACALSEALWAQFRAEGGRKGLPAGSGGLAEHAGDDNQTDRQQWILERLRAAGKLTRQDVEKQFGVGEKQAKRELTALTAAGLARFVARPRPGYYALTEAGASTCQANSRRASTVNP
jgi:hypothetical protein